MMSGLIILSIALTVFIGAMCIRLYRQQAEALRQIKIQQELLTNLERAFKDLDMKHSQSYKRLDQLATDVLQREIYKNADDRHQLAIQSAKQGKGHFELMQRHGLSSDEAALISSLHSPQSEVSDAKVRNANLVDPVLVGQV